MIFSLYNKIRYIFLDYSTVDTRNFLRKPSRSGRPMVVMGQAGVVILGKKMGGERVS